MIDRKKIQEAAASKFNPTVGGLANTTERIAFEKGVDWFKHAIWHDRDEEPTEDGLVLQHLSCDGKEYIRAYNWVQMKKKCIEYGKRKGTSQEEIDEWSRNVWARDGNFDNWCYLSDLLPTK